MAYPRRNYRRNYRRRRPNNNYRRKPNNYRKAMSVAKTAYQAYNIASRVAGLINSEHKHSTTLTASPTAVSATGTSLGSWCNTIQQGTSDDDRIGDQMKVKNFYMKGQVNFVPGGHTTQLLRVMVILDPSASAVGAGSQILQGGANTTTAVFAPKNRTNKHDFKILFDRVYSVSDQKPSAKLNIFLKDLDTIVRYSPGITTVSGNDIKVLFISNELLASPAKPTIEYFSQLSFIDT